jgi:hypothetical protein
MSIADDIRELRGFDWNLSLCRLAMIEKLLNRLEAYEEEKRYAPCNRECNRGSTRMHDTDGHVDMG